MKFDEKRLGYGVENPLIKKGAKGYFSDYLKNIKNYVENQENAGCFYGELTEEPSLDRTKAYQKDAMTLAWQFFYVMEEV